MLGHYSRAAFILFQDAASSKHKGLRRACVCDCVEGKDAVASRGQEASCARSHGYIKNNGWSIQTWQSIICRRDAHREHRPWNPNPFQWFQHLITKIWYLEKTWWISIASSGLFLSILCLVGIFGKYMYNFILTGQELKLSVIQLWLLTELQISEMTALKPRFNLSSLLNGNYRYLWSSFDEEEWKLNVSTVIMASPNCGASAHHCGGLSIGYWLNLTIKESTCCPE